MPLVAIHMTCEEIRLSSVMSIRIQVARGGSSTPSSSSTASEKTSSLWSGAR